MTPSYEPQQSAVPEKSLEEKKAEAIADLEMYQSKFSEVETAIKNELTQLEKECKDMQVTSDVEQQIDSYMATQKDTLQKIPENKKLISDALRKVKYESNENQTVLPTDELMDNLRSVVSSYEKINLSRMVDICKENQIKVFKVGDEVEAGNFKWKVTGIKRKSFVGEYVYNSLIGEKANGQFLIISFEVTNIADSPKMLSDQLVRLFDTKGREYMPSTTAAFYEDNQGSIFLDTLNPLLTKEATLVFDVVPNTLYELRVYPNVASTSYSIIKTMV
jgi:hypothetical protein